MPTALIRRLNSDAIATPSPQRRGKRARYFCLNLCIFVVAVRQNAQTAVLLATFGFGHIPQVCSLQPQS